ncbi:hypothetical protein HN371_17150 [Candidatus Poribacteria bacterium]|jgi:hypothetical protein|nr:hypothetical protein [Candidatus Poribacteria bacterium]MBT5534489.1 hypothetical protein [Candidatus Poribacteria bacterium]MBT5711642.1 hypothetical protein [Candidatus Poribacteria bacterium]MBT7098588.1 hypothetical protein [Candidatus Poribacteria bacterium]MBT7806914.1 hypothetical protein [Candidatus Poribacteria bacterium]
MEKGRGTLILVLSILAFACSCLPLGVPAWIMGNTDLKRMDRGEISDDDRTITKIGMILGMVATVLLVLGAIWAAFLGGLATLGTLVGSLG